MNKANFKLLLIAVSSVFILTIFQNCGDSSDPVAVSPVVPVDPLDVVVISDTSRSCEISSNVTASNGECLNESVSCSLNPWMSQFSGTSIAVNSCSSLNNLITFNGLNHVDSQTYIATNCVSTSSITACNDNSADDTVSTPTSCTTSTNVSLLCEYNGSNITVSGHTTCPNGNHGDTCVNNFVLDYGTIDYANSSITYQCFNGTWQNSQAQSNHCKLNSYSPPATNNPIAASTNTCTVTEYCNNAPNLANCSTAAFSHYYMYGQYEGRCRPIFTGSPSLFQNGDTHAY